MEQETIYQLSEEEYLDRVRDLSADLVDEFRQKVYDRVYGIVASHVDEPDEYDELVNMLVNECLIRVRESL